ncbi:MAG: DUF2612 domain-containing protein [Methanobrevibacter sp.]|nr:DUF2612 domain-containing protein [Methanobrevibacter sp.]
MFNIQEKVEGIVKSYEGYIPAQFIDKPKAKATIDFIIRVALANAIYEQLAVAFSMDEASGKVLDMIADNFGLSRNLPTTALIKFFQNPDYAEVGVDVPAPIPGVPPYIGFTDYSSDTNYDSVFRRYASQDSLTSSTPDSILKQVILFKVLAGRCRGSLESIISLLNATGLGGFVSITDGGDRTIVYRVRTEDSLLANIIYNLGYFPRPIGIESTLVVVNNPLGIFHFLSYGDQPLGFCFNAYGYELNGRSWLQYGEQ